MHARAIDAGAGSQRLAQGGAGGIVADHANQVAARPGGGDVGGDIGRAARRIAPVGHVHHRHRCLRRDALDVADEVPVEHQVADDRDP